MRKEGVPGPPAAILESRGEPGSGLSWPSGRQNLDRKRLVVQLLLDYFHPKSALFVNMKQFFILIY